jgi:hypothetical protein
MLRRETQENEKSSKIDTLNMYRLKKMRDHIGETDKNTKLSFPFHILFPNRNRKYTLIVPVPATCRIMLHQIQVRYLSVKVAI